MRTPNTAEWHMQAAEAQASRSDLQERLEKCKREAGAIQAQQQAEIHRLEQVLRRVHKCHTAYATC
jgi:hypothetical protein